MSHLNTPAANRYRDNLQVFQSLKTHPNGAKLYYDAASGVFQAQSGFGTGFVRSFQSNQSVTNDNYFSQPIRETFLEAVLENKTTPADLLSSLEGLRKLRTTYNSELDKLRKLQTVLTDVQDIIQGHRSISNEFLERWKAADPQRVFSEADLKFLNSLFLDGDILNYPLTHRGEGNLPKGLSSKIYGKYNAVRTVDPVADPLSWIQSLPLKLNPQLQNHGLRLKRNHNKIVNDSEFATDFIYYQAAEGRPDLKDQLLWRVYLNFRAPDAAAVLRTLIANRRSYFIKSFKIAGPDAFSARSDKIVVYLYSYPQAKGLADLLHRQHPHVFQDPSPAMTIGVHPGIAVGKEPKMMALGFSPSDKPGGYKAQSYGTIRAELLASAVLHYDENKSQFIKMNEAKSSPDASMGNPRIAFLKCAAVAFSGYADALRPDLSE